MNFTFKKSERLTSKKVMEEIFNSGKNLKAFPFILKYHLVNNLESPVQIAISVPKKKFKRAVDRNRIKRQIREAYRLNKNPLVTKMKEENKNLAFFLIYNADKKLDYHIIEEKIKLLLNELIEKA